MVNRPSDGSRSRGYERAPELLGYMQFEYEERPMLVWLTPDGRIEGEDLN